MTVYRHVIAGMGFCCLVISSAHGQDNLPNAGTDSLTTEKVPHTTAVGQTKPPSRDASPTSVKAIDRPTPRQAADDAIATKICIGCKSDPVTTGALPDQPATNPSAEKLGTKLDELRTTAPPQQQSDLNTFDLASAHRERAKSIEEKTDGLWQSWLVSVCEGCGNQKPARAMRYEEWPDREPLSVKKSSAEKVKPGDNRKVVALPHETLEADLSPETVGSIRRMPQR